MAEAVKVIVRCRPMNGREIGLNCQNVVDIENRTASCSINNPSDKKAPPKRFTFDGAYDVDSNTEQIYADIGFPLVEGVTEGYNGTIFAYGQTGCGKSFTMQGITDPSNQRGIIPRAFDHIFETIQVSESSKYLVHASYLEIYNEEIRDLLGKDIKMKLDLKENPDKGIYVQSLSKHPCKNVPDCQAVMERGWKNRSTGSTLMNADSSRSHSIFSIHLERCDKDERGEEHIKGAKLNLVDLAGSERQAKTGASGDRLKEATKINLSLSALGNVISALVDGKSTHIPYRDSKLTRLLQDSLGGNTKTLMIACLSPADNNYDETLSTLRYANRAKNIKNKPKINEDPKDAMLREYQGEIERLKAMLRGDMPVQIDGQKGGVSQKDIEEEKARLRQEFEQEMKNLKEELKAAKLSKEQMEDEVDKLKNNYEKQMAKVENSGKTYRKSKNNDGDDNDNDDDNEDDDDKKYTQGSTPVHAIHVGTHKGKKPISSTDDVVKRLQELQQNFVGGELSNNEEIKEKRKKNKKYAEDTRRKLQEALSRDGDDIVVGMFKNVQDELKYKNKLLEKEKQKSESLRCEIMDIQQEFEFDRIDYLDTIRKQEQQLKYFQAVLSRIQPLIRKDCNFSNLDKIKSQAEWDEINKNWILPKVVVDKGHLPSANPPLSNNGNRMLTKDPFYNNQNNFDDYDDQKFMQKLQNSDEQEIAKNYFKNTRQEEILNATSNYDIINNDNNSSSSLSSSFNSSSNNNIVGNGNTRMRKIPPSPRLGPDNDDPPMLRKPIRLEALPLNQEKPKKGGGKKNSKNSGGGGGGGGGGCGGGGGGGCGSGGYMGLNQNGY